MSENDRPSMRDLRSSSATGRSGDDEYERLYRRNQRQIRNVRWAPGQDPHDDDAHPDSGWQYVKLDGAETPDSERDVDQYRDLAGPGAGVQCFRCHGAEFRIVQERTPAEIIATRPDLEWSLKMNRPIDPWSAPRLLMLFCPACKHMVQMAEQAVATIRRQQEERDDG